MAQVSRSRAAWIASVVLLVVAGGTAIAVLAITGSDSDDEARPTRAFSAGGLSSRVPDGWVPEAGRSRFEIWLAGRSTSEEDGCGGADRVFIDLMVEPGDVPELGRPLRLPTEVGSSVAEIRTGEAWVDCIDSRVQQFNVEVDGRPFHVTLLHGPDAESGRLAEAYAIVEHLRLA